MSYQGQGTKRQTWRACRSDRLLSTVLNWLNGDPLTPPSPAFSPASSPACTQQEARGSQHRPYLSWALHISCKQRHPGCSAHPTEPCGGAARLLERAQRNRLAHKMLSERRKCPLEFVGKRNISCPEMQIVCSDYN